MNDTSPEFAQRLHKAGLTQTRFRKLVYLLGGATIASTTTSRWVQGTRKAPPCAKALLGLIARIPPSELVRFMTDEPPDHLPHRSRSRR